MGVPRWLRAPTFPEPEKTARAASVWGVTLALLIADLTSTALTFYGFVWPTTPVPLVAILLTTMSFCAVLALVRLGHVNAGARLLVISLWVLLTATIAITGGIESPINLAYVVVILAGGLLIGEAAAISSALASVTAVLTYAMIATIGIPLPEPIVSLTPEFFAFELIAVFVASCVIIVFAGRQVRTSHKLTMRYEAELQQAQKLEAVGRLAGGVAHDFNNLLTGILGFGEVLKLRTKDDPKAQEAAAQVCSAAESAADLTAQLLAFSRRPVHRPGPVDLNECVRRIAPMLRRLVGDDVEIRLALADGIDPVAGQHSLLEQIVVNLTVNARDAMPKGGAIRITTAAARRRIADTRGGTVSLIISDTGTGMDPAVSARAFEPFFTTKPGGTGLGLSSVYGAARQCGGAVFVDSREGVGTTFEVVLPVVERTTFDSTDPAANRHHVAARCILLAEDDDRVRAYLVQVLEGAGHTVFSARSGDEAIELAGKIDRPIDLLVSDVVMPGIDGVETMNTLLSSHPSMRVLLVSGYSNHPGTDAESLPERATFMQKPFGADEFNDKVSEILDRPGRATAG